ncbi:MAG: peptide deformylase [Bacteroidetes bacterium]|uniref:Peptide deformylase n=1 Tax=Candidatus Caccoplasma merdipullorum TaxID=2840718 RepID=A0A9D9E3Z1_9BACT|nr:peptide deformylase [Candidatus Caccoplasma merdipullorum]
MILPIYLYGTSVLRKQAEDITKEYPELPKLIKDMYETLERSEGIGLAAPQVGLPIRLLILDLNPLSDIYPQYKGVLKTMINAHIEETDGSPVSREEGCLSLPGIHESVTRKEKIKVTYLDENFEQHTEWFEGYMARVIQHEYDHLEGRLFIDHLSPIRKQLIKSKLNAILKGKVSCDYKVKGIK